MPQERPEGAGRGRTAGNPAAGRLAVVLRALPVLGQCAEEGLSQGETAAMVPSTKGLDHLRRQVGVRSRQE